MKLLQAFGIVLVLIVGSALGATVLTFVLQVTGVIK